MNGPTYLKVWDCPAKDLSHNELISDALCPVFQTPISTITPRTPSLVPFLKFGDFGPGTTSLVLIGHYIRGRVQLCLERATSQWAYAAARALWLQVKIVRWHCCMFLFFHLLTFNPSACFPHWAYLSHAARLADDGESGGCSDNSRIRWVTIGANLPDHPPDMKKKTCIFLKSNRHPLLSLDKPVSVPLSFDSATASILFLSLLRTLYVIIIVPVFTCVDFSPCFTSLVTPLKPSCLTPPPTPRSRQA